MDYNNIKSAYFLQRSTLFLAWSGLVILTPFSVNNFIQGRYVLGIGSLVIIGILAVNAWGLRHSLDYHYLILFGLVPAIIFFLVLSIRKQGMVGILWCYPSVISFYMMLPERKAWLLNVALLVITQPFAWSVIEPHLAIRMTATLFAVSIFTAIFIRVITEQQDRLHEIATTDPLTGVLNRTTLDDTLEEAIQINKRTAEPMTLIFLDLDHFKAINDSHGHDAGDRVLQSVAALLRHRLRRIDRIYRLGGEEFLVFLHGTDAANGAKIAEELRQEVASLKNIPDQATSVSLGIAGLQADDNLATWMKRGDENLYRAKAEGRNRVIA